MLIPKAILEKSLGRAVLFTRKNTNLSSHLIRLRFEEDALGKGSPETAITCDKIACDYLDLGNCKEALKYFRKTISILKRFPELEEPNRYLLYENAGYTCECLEQYKQALEYYMEAAPGYEENFEADDDRTGNLYYRIAVTYAALNQDRDALAWLVRSMNTDYEPADKECRKYFRKIKNALKWNELKHKLRRKEL